MYALSKDRAKAKIVGHGGHRGHLKREAIPPMHRRFTSLAARVLVACLPALGLVMAVGAGTASASRTPASARAAALAVLEHLKIGEDGTNHLVGQSVGGAPKHVTSQNWSGYADIKTSGKYSKVTGSWTEPEGTCTSTRSMAVFWVGIDGYNNGTVEQDGTIVECNGGKASYFSWWEMFPTNAIQVVGKSVQPGDHISASVSRSGTRYTLKVTDSTTPADSFTTTKTCSASNCLDSSAEWIAEAPSGSPGVFPLTNFGTWTLTGATVKVGTKAGTISKFPDSEITMTDISNKVEAQPDALNAQGSQFKVTWKRST